MGMVLTDTLPVDAGTQKFVAPIDSTTALFVLLRALNVETVDTLDYGDQGVSLGAGQGATTQTHDAVTVTTAESVGTQVISAGYSKAAIFVEVEAGADIAITVYGRLITAGDNYTLAILETQEASSRHVYLVEIACPYLAIGLTAVADSAVCSCSVHLLPA